jgi:hypothetical protein
MGEIMFRGNIVMKGYLKNPEGHRKRPSPAAGSTAATWRCMYPDGYIKIKDRSKDIIISGGENISSIEVEDVLYRHPACWPPPWWPSPTPKWGETPCAFVELKPGARPRPRTSWRTARSTWRASRCRAPWCSAKLPKTSTGKIQKFELRKPPITTPSRRGSAPPSQHGLPVHRAAHDGLQAAGHVLLAHLGAARAQRVHRGGREALFFQQAGPLREPKLGRLMARCGIRPQLSVAVQRLGRVVDDQRAAGAAAAHQELAAGLVEHQRGRHGRARPFAGLHAVGNGLALRVGGAKLKSVSSLLSRKPPRRAALVVTIWRAPKTSSMVVVMARALPKRPRC